jgi:hypothetical protein
MRRFHLGKAVPVVLVSSFAALASAMTPDPRPISLVPPTATLVAGVKTANGGDLSTLVLTTHSNVVDLNDFTALWAVDSSRAIDQIITVASGRNSDPYAEHGLIANGRFNQALIERSVHQAGANPTSYRGIAIMELPPLARERDTFQDVRWLVMMHSNLALFGTIPIVKQELDRYLAREATDPSLERMLAHLQRDDDTWCVAKLQDGNSEIQSIFAPLDSRLARLLGAGDTVQVGVRYGRRVEFEYEVDVAPGVDPQPASRALMESLISSKPAERAALPAADWSRSDGGVRGVLTLSRTQYQTWIAQVMGSQADLHAAAGTPSH